MIEIAICDDDKKDQEIIQRFIDRYMEEKNISHVIWTYKSGEELLVSDHSFHILFLDIAMGKGINGIIAGKKFHSISRKTKIIYITSFQQYIEQAFNGVHAFAYLDKQVIKDKIDLQLDEALKIIQEEQNQKQIVSFEVIENTQDHHIDTIIKLFNVEDIFYFEYFNRRIKMRTVHGDYYFIDQMKNLIRKMSEYPFESCHQSFLVNLRYVKKIKGYDLFLETGEMIPVSQKKSARFRDKLHKFIKNTI